MIVLGLNGLDADRSACLFFNLKLTVEPSARIIQGRFATVGQPHRRLPEQLVSGKVLGAAGWLPFRVPLLEEAARADFTLGSTENSRLLHKSEQKIRARQQSSPCQNFIVYIEGLLSPTIPAKPLGLPMSLLCSNASCLT